MGSDIEPIAVGDVVRYVDIGGETHYALVTAVFGSFIENVPTANLAYVNPQDMSNDIHGGRIERAVSVPHKTSLKSPKGPYWLNIV